MIVALDWFWKVDGDGVTTRVDWAATSEAIHETVQTDNHANANFTSKRTVYLHTGKSRGPAAPYPSAIRRDRDRETRPVQWIPTPAAVVIGRKASR